MQKIILTLGAGILSAILYRMGGAERFNTKCRDLGVPACATGLLLAFRHNFGIWGWLAVLASFLGLFGAMTTYWKKKGADARWWNWALTGFFYGLSASPLIWAGIHWYAVAARILTLTILIVWWSEWQGNVVWEECGRGFIVTASIPLILI